MADAKSGYYEVWAPTGRKRKGSDQDEPWARVGICFPLKSGEGFSIKLNALPIAGTLIVKPPSAPKAAKADAPADSGETPF